MNYFVSASPHIRSRATTGSIMRDVVYALLPACAVGIVVFGYKAAIVLAVSVLSAVVTEHVLNLLMKRPSTVSDYSAVVTGLLLGMNLPSTAPWWLALIGSAFAIAIVKMPFGGIGCNFVNPALAARAMLMACWPVRMTAWTDPAFTVTADAVASATPLAAMKAGGEVGYSLLDMLVGTTSGCIGEVSAIALILGAVYLLIRGVINLRIPLSYILTVFILSLCFRGFDAAYAGMQVLSGGLMLGALFMANDYTTSPITPWGQIIMGVGCGLITVLIRQIGGYPEGVSYSILLMNLATPLIERVTRPKAFGEALGKRAVMVKKKEAAK